MLKDALNETILEVQAFTTKFIFPKYVRRTARYPQLSSKYFWTNWLNFFNKQETNTYMGQMPVFADKQLLTSALPELATSVRSHWFVQLFHHHLCCTHELVSRPPLFKIL
jgi:hypothetical protein